MNTQELLDQLLQSAKTYAEKGKDIAEEKLSIPAEGEARDAKLDGIKKGAIIAGAAAILLGTKTGRSVTGTALKLGSLAAVGGLAYQAFQKWKDGDNTANDNLEYQSSKNDEVKSLVLLKAIIAAAKADGHVSDEEFATIRSELAKLDLDMDINTLIAGVDADAAAVATHVNSKELAAEVYLVSSLVLDRSNSQAEAYRQDLIKALNLPEDLVKTLDDSQN